MKSVSYAEQNIAVPLKLRYSFVMISESPSIRAIHC